MKGKEGDPYTSLGACWRGFTSLLKEQLLSMVEDPRRGRVTLQCTLELF